MSIPQVRLNIAPRLPASVTSDGGIAAAIASGNLSITQDWSALPVATLPELDDAELLSFDPVSGQYKRTTVGDVAAAGLGSSAIPDVYKTRSELAAYAPPVAPQVIYITGDTGRECPPHPFYKVSGDPGHDAAFSIVADGVTTWYEFSGAVLYPEVLGPTTGADCSATLLLHAAVAAAGKAPSLALMPGKTYNVLSGVTYPDWVPFNGNGATVSGAAGVTLGNFPQDTGSGGAERAPLKFRGSLTAIPDLSANVSRGDLTVTFASAHGLAAGDVFSIHNPTSGSYSLYRTYYTAGEFCEVARVISTTQVELVRPLYAAYMAAACDCHKLGQRSATIQNVRAVAPTALPSVSAMNFVWFNGGATINCSGVHADGNDALLWDRCYKTRNDDCSGFCIRPGMSPGTGGAQYGLAFVSCQGMQGVGLLGEGDRHGIAYGGGTRPAGIVNRDCHFKGRFTGRYDLAADWHGNAEFCTYDGDYYGGVNIGGHGHKVTGRVFMKGCGSPTRVAVNFGEPTSFQHEIQLYIDQPDDTWSGTSGTNGYLVYGLFGCIFGEGQSAPFSDKLLYAGTLTLDLTINAPTSRGGIAIYKNGASRTGCIVDLKRIAFVGGVAASGQILRVQDTVLYAGDTTTNRIQQLNLGQLDPQLFNSGRTIDSQIPRAGQMPPIYFTATYDAPSIANGAIHQWTQSVTGVSDGDDVSVAFAGDELGVQISAEAYNGGVQTTIRNDQGVARDLASGTWRWKIEKWL